MILKGLDEKSGVKEIPIDGFLYFDGKRFFDAAYPTTDEEGNIDHSRVLCIADDGWFHDNEGKGWFKMEIVE